MENTRPPEAAAPAPPPPAGLRQALQRESARIVDCKDIASSLEKLLRFEFELWRRPGPPLRVRPKLILRPQRSYRDAGYEIDKIVWPALEVLSVVLSHSFRLNTSPMLKVEFWRGLLTMSIWDRPDLSETMSDWPQMIQDESFPDFRIDMDRKGVMTEMHLESFFEFLTTPPTHGVDAKYAREYDALTKNERVPVGLVPGITKMTARCLIIVACDANSSPASSSTSRKSPKQPSGLRSLDLINTSLGLKHAMALCSTLCYGSPIETLSLKNILKKIDEAEREQCWGWLAFGIFYPRSKRLASANRLCHVDLSHNSLQPCDAKALAKTLLDPAGELVYSGKASQQRKPTAKGKLLICRVKKGAKFFAMPKIGAVISKLGYERELEVLCQQRGWTCVVLPGLGFGWVSEKQVVDMAEEVIDDSDLRVELTFTASDINRFPMEGPIAAFKTLIEHVGRYLSYLDVSDSFVGRILVETVWKHCVNVEHLVLVNACLDDQRVDGLLKILDGDLGGRLKSLNLRGNSFGVDVQQKFATFLMNPKRIPALQELRLLQHRLVDDAFAAFQNVLLVNKTLHFVELMEPDLYRLDHRHFLAL